MLAKQGTHDYGSVLPGVVLLNVRISRCTRCDDFEVSIPMIEDLHREIAWRVVEKRGRLTPEEIRFLRKHLDLSSADFAAHMGARPETISRWENGSAAMGAIADRLLRLMVVHREPAKDYALEALKGATAGAARPVKIQMTPAPARGWRAA